jgi:hypothetical protein
MRERDQNPHDETQARVVLYLSTHDTSTYIATAVDRSLGCMSSLLAPLIHSSIQPNSISHIHLLIDIPPSQWLK